MALFNIFNIFNMVNCFTARNSFAAGLIYISSAFCKLVLIGWSFCSLGLTVRPLPRVSCFGVVFRLTGRAVGIDFAEYGRASALCGDSGSSWRKGDILSKEALLSCPERYNHTAIH